MTKPHILLDLTFAPGADAGTVHSATHSASLLAQSSYWTTSVLVRQDDAPGYADMRGVAVRIAKRMPATQLETRDVDLAVFQGPTAVKVSHGTVKVIRLHTVEPLRAADAEPADTRAIAEFQRALGQCLRDGSYFACVSEQVREQFLAFFPRVRHRSSVLPISADPENELAHWQELIRNLTRTAEIPVSAPIRETRVKARPVEFDRPLSVIVGSERVDDRLRICLDILTVQAAPLGAEVIVGLREPCTAEQKARWPSIHFFTDPKGSVISLRAQGGAMSSGEIIAFTEDHAVVCDDWCSLILESHRAHPEAAVVYGPVKHGGPYSMTSWANFYSIFGLNMPSMPFPPPRRVPPIVAISVKRSFVPADAWEKPGWFEFVGLPLYYDYGLCVADYRQVITHVQHHGLFATYWAHFHNARVTTGTRALPFARELWRAQFKDTLYQPVQSIWIDWATLWEMKAERGRLLTSLPAYVGISLSQVAGEMAGLFFGSGRSAQYLD